MSDRSDLSQFSWGRSEPKVVRWQIKDQSCFSYPEMMFQINLCYFLCWLVSLLLSWVQCNYSIGGKYCANVRLLQNTFTSSPWCIRAANGNAHNRVKWPGYKTSSSSSSNPLLNTSVSLIIRLNWCKSCFYTIDQSDVNILWTRTLNKRVLLS